MLRISFYFIILLSSFISAGNVISGNWLNIGISDEGVYNNEPYSGTIYPDTIEYMMIVDSSTCKAYTFHENRIYSISHTFTISNDSIYSQALETPLTWKISNDTLFTSNLYTDNNEWEKVTFIFISTNSTQIPNNWPNTNDFYIPDKLTPFGLYSFGCGPGNPLSNRKPYNRMSKIEARKKVSYFQLNGRICNKPGVNITQVMINNDNSKHKNRINIFMK